MRTKLKNKIINNSNKCAICSNTNDLEVHHVHPISHGGTNGFANLIILCRTCHRVKTNSFKKLTGAWIKVYLRKQMRLRNYPDIFIEAYLKQLPTK